MAKISEITSDGGDPNKKAQEEENQNKKPKQQVVQRIPQDLPEEINERILTLLGRCDYPSLLCTSKAFRKIITLPRLFETRSQLGRTEHVLYTFIRFPPFFLSRWFILHRRNNSLRLSMIGSLPPVIPGSVVVTIEHDMYIIGGCLDRPVSTVIVIDCRFHTWRRLPSMRRTRYHAAAGVIDGKIYVIGGCIKRGGDWIEVFDVKNQIWETVPDPNPNTASMDGIFPAYMVMEEKIYIFDRTVTGGCLTYEPRRRKWEYWGILSPLWRFWHVSSCCVVDDMLYSIDTMCSFGYPIVVYDPRNVVWRPVKGVRRSDLLNLVYHESKMANLGGKLVILGSNYPSWCIPERDIWCQVIALERREDGEIWGNVESKSRVLSSFKSPLVKLCRTVTV